MGAKLEAPSTDVIGLFDRLLAQGIVVDTWIRGRTPSPVDAVGQRMALANDLPSVDMSHDDDPVRWLRASAPGNKH